MRKWILALALVAAALPVALTGQATLDKTLEGQLKKAFPAASSFSTKQAGPPPHFVAYTQEGNAKAVAGYVFWTTELEPLERGYDGPIKMLVGVDKNGILTGVLVVEHHEPYGNFSVDRPEFARQFKGKSIKDPFKVGGDVDAVARASITMKNAALVIRNGARRIARAFLTPPAAK